MRSICWFRNDLRVLDNPALHNACLNSQEVIGVYLTTFEQWEMQNDAQTKINFWFRNLENLKTELEKLNIPLVILDAETFANSPKFYGILSKKMMFNHFILITNILSMN